MQNRFGLLDTDVMPMFMIIALDIVIIMCSSINCSAVICSPTALLFFSREATSETYDPGSSFSYYLPLRSISFLFMFRSIKPKNTKIPSCNLFYLAFDLSIYYNLPHVCLPILRRRTPEGIDNPFNMSGCEYLLFVRRCYLRSVA